MWTEFVRKREERKGEKQARKRRAKKPQPTPAEREAVLDDLVARYDARRSRVDDE
jgi:hypothetical protein